MSLDKYIKLLFQYNEIISQSGWFERIAPIRDEMIKLWDQMTSEQQRLAYQAQQAVYERMIEP